MPSKPFLTSLLLSLSALSHAWLPTQHPSRDLSAFNSTSSRSTLSGRSPPPEKIKGVNLGSFLLIEPWMVPDAWGKIGCSDVYSEFACVQKLGQDAANAAFKEHWDTWLPQSDLQLMKDYGLNTVRIPVGYWIVEDLVREGEFYPKGGLEYLDRFVGWAADAGVYVILDLHGGPGVQAKDQSFAGNTVSEPGFFNTDEFNRGYGFLEFMTSRIHSNDAYRTVGMIEVINEPDRGFDNLVHEYYPEALRRIRGREDSLNVAADERVHVQFMNTAWGAGDANAELPSDDAFLFYDQHTYFKYNPDFDHSQGGYLYASCNAEPGSDGDKPVSVGEWSIDVQDQKKNDPEFEIGSDNNLDFYRKYIAAQIVSFEKQGGWVFWSWKTEQGNDFRWSYKAAVERGVIGKDPGEAYNVQAC